jgi:cytochrome b6-f complex iron-sulfur subunit
MTVAAQPPRSRLDPEPMPRRDWLGLTALGAMGGALIFGLIGLLRLPKAAVLPSPSKKYRITLPDTLAPGQAFVPPNRAVAIFQDAEGTYALSIICTHLGCIIKPTTEGFECPCHGSRFHEDGTVSKGPAPRPLPWLKVSRNDSQLMVDEGTTVPAGTKVV